jgi:epoxide hydrolase-like predicted phosphatase
MAINTVIFDLHGVVLFTIRSTFSGMLAERLGVPVERVQKVMNDPINDQWDKGEISDDVFYDHMLTVTGQPPEKKTVIQKFMIEDFYIDQEMLALIRELRKSYTTALLSNFPAHVHEFFKSTWFIDGAFDHLVISSDVKLLKPDPRIYELALERAGCQPQEAVFIDDRSENIKAAEDLGIKGILFSSKAQTITDLGRVLKAAR